MLKRASAGLARAVRWVAAVAAAVVVAVTGFSGTALANFPHFQDFSVTTTTTAAYSASTRLVSGGATATIPDLLFTWTEAGLGNTNVVYDLHTVVTATFGCVNNGSNHPQASNKTTVTAPVDQTAELAADKNGNISGSVVVDTASVSPSGFSCPQGQTVAAISATYADNTITDTTNNVSATVGNIVVNLGP